MQQSGIMNNTNYEANCQEPVATKQEHISTGVDLLYAYNYTSDRFNTKRNNYNAHKKTGSNWNLGEPNLANVYEFRHHSSLIFFLNIIFWRPGDESNPSTNATTQVTVACRPINGQTCLNRFRPVRADDTHHSTSFDLTDDQLESFHLHHLPVWPIRA